MNIGIIEQIVPSAKKLKVKSVPKSVLNCLNVVFKPGLPQEMTVVEHTVHKLAIQVHNVWEQENQVKQKYNWYWEEEKKKKKIKECIHVWNYVNNTKTFLYIFF